MQREYYFLALNNNKTNNPIKLDNIIYKGEEYNLPEVFVEAIKESVFEGVEVLAYKGFMTYIDLITGEVINYSSNGIYNGLSYYKEVKVSQKDLIRIKNIYENMTSEDIKRYKDRIQSIKKLSIDRYKSSLKNDYEDELNARRFLADFSI